MLLTLCVTTPTASSTALRDAAAAHKRGRALAGHLKTEQAIEVLEEALGLFRRALGDLPDISPIADCLIDLGAAWLDAGQEDHASAEFHRALVIAPTRELDRNQYSPAVVALFAKARRQLARTPTSPLSIVSNAIGAQARVDDQPLGLVPLSIPALAVGEHYLVVSCAGYDSFAAPIVVGDSGRPTVEVFLRRRTDLLATSPSPEPPARAPMPAAVALAVPPVRVRPLLAVMPLGIGQFAEHRPLAGTLFLSSEVVLLATNIVTGVLSFSDKLPNGYYKNGPRDRLLQGIDLAAFGLLVVAVAANGIDGFVHRNSQ